MAINIIQGLDEWMPLYNNNYLKFEVVTGETIAKARLLITLDGESSTSTYEFYPINNTFTINVSTIINASIDIRDRCVENFATPYLPFINGDVHIIVVYLDGSVETTDVSIINALASVVQVGDVDDDARRTYMHPTSSRNTITLNYWAGFPFALYSRGGRTLLNRQLGRELLIGDEQFRTIVDDGKGEDWTHTNEMPLVEGVNKLVDTNITLNVKKHIQSCGIYLRWYNSRGGFDSWLFDEYFVSEIESKNIGEVQNTSTESIFNRSGDFISLGNTFTEELTIETKYKTDDYALLRGVLTSPRVQMYTSRNAYIEGRFIDVMVDGKNKRTSKKNSEKFSLTLLLPSGNTIKL